jgi:uncharacterized iron-regulated membrane protein
MFVVVFVGTRGLVSIVACVSGLFMFVVVFVRINQRHKQQWKQDHEYQQKQQQT